MYQEPLEWILADHKILILVQGRILLTKKIHSKFHQCFKNVSKLQPRDLKKVCNSILIPQFNPNNKILGCKKPKKIPNKRRLNL